MKVDVVGLWVLIGVCCAGALAYVVPRELRREFYAGHARWRDAPARFAGACAGALLNAVGVGLGFALIATMLGALLARVV